MILLDLWVVLDRLASLSFLCSCWTDGLYREGPGVPLGGDWMTTGGKRSCRQSMLRDRMTESERWKSRPGLIHRFIDLVGSKRVSIWPLTRHFSWWIPETSSVPPMEGRRVAWGRVITGFSHHEITSGRLEASWESMTRGVAVYIDIRMNFVISQ